MLLLYLYTFFRGTIYVTSFTLICSLKLKPFLKSHKSRIVFLVRKEHSKIEISESMKVLESMSVSVL